MKIFVAKLNFKTSTELLKGLFEEFGTVTSAKVVTDRETGRSKGFGFVEMENDAEAIKAIKALNGAEFDGRTIAVQESQEKPREDRGGNRGNYGGGRGGDYRGNRR